jgi:hypothetical protein
MRTEDDLRDALVTLERHAPDADAVLRAVHDAAKRRQPRLTHAPWSPRPSWFPRRPRLVLGAAVAAAAAAGLVIALLPGTAPSGTGSMWPHGAVTARLPSAASVGKAMLAAFNAARGDIVYATEAARDRGVVVERDQDWFWPAQPVPGQRARMRSMSTARASRTAKTLRLIEDMGFIYTTPSWPQSTMHGQMTFVCYRGTSGCGVMNTEIPAGTWFRVSGKLPAMSTDIGPGGMFNPATLARAIATEQWRVLRRTQLDGQQAIELRETRSGPFEPKPNVPVLLWVGAHTHLPLRWIAGGTSEKTAVAYQDYAYLPPTAANLALLRVPIPPGYPRFSPTKG